MKIQQEDLKFGAKYRAVMPKEQAKLFSKLFQFDDMKKAARADLNALLQSKEIKVFLDKFPKEDTLELSWQAISANKTRILNGENVGEYMIIPSLDYASAKISTKTNLPLEQIKDASSADSAKKLAEWLSEKLKDFLS